MVGGSEDVGPAELAELAEKYETLASLRRAHDRGEPPPSNIELRRLAARFPGALYELDTLALAVIEQRAADLRRAGEPDESSDLPAWMRWMARYHVLVREILAARRAGPKAPTPRRRATAMAIEAIAAESGATEDEIEAALFARRRRGVNR